MNLLLVSEEDFVSAQVVSVSGRRHQHLRRVIGIRPGSTLRTGYLNGPIGSAVVLDTREHDTRLQVAFDASPPPSMPVTLALALPRPKMLKRLLQAVTSLGVKKIYLIGSYRVEKSYWQSPWLSAPKIRESLVLGLEQAMDTRLPEVCLRRFFKPFVEDELPALCADGAGLLAHPGARTPLPVKPAGHSTTLMVGPERGFTPYEVELAQASGLRPVCLGPRTLKVDTAVIAALSRLL